MDKIIEIKNLSKKFKIGHQKHTRYNTLREDLIDGFKKPLFWVLGKKDTSENIWALKDVSFSVEQGEILGIIGPNGAGKTTLLKILTRITPPTEGRAIIRGRIGSLLEVGTGFHPELTGRENIYLNGAILGMKKKEIDKKFNEIVEFSGVKQFLDTPLKRYSAGMNVRLAFSVAAHLEPDILLIDEVLAVGDAAFQKKSLSKMEEITKKSGRTILFISHDMGAIQHLCTRCVFLDKGKVKIIGPTRLVVKKYLDDISDNSESSFRLTEERKSQTTGGVRFIKAVVQNENGEEIKNVYSGQNIKIILYYVSQQGMSFKNVRVSLNLNSPFGERITSFYSHVAGSEFKSIPQKGHFIINIPNLPLAPGIYSFTCFLAINNYIYADWVSNAGHIEVVGNRFFPSQYPVPEGQAIFYIKHSWDIAGD